MGNESLKVLENSLNFLFLKGYEPCTCKVVVLLNKPFVCLVFFAFLVAVSVVVAKAPYSDSKTRATTRMLKNTKYCACVNQRHLGGKVVAVVIILRFFARMS